MTDDEPTPEARKEFETMFNRGNFWILVGPRGSAKTTFAASVMSAAVKWYSRPWTTSDCRGVVCMTNILLKRKIVDESGNETFEECYPPGVYKVQSLSDVFHLLPDILEQKKNVLLIIDEALQSEGFASGQTVLSAAVREVRSFASIIRHIRICVVLIAQSWKMVQSSYRNADFISGLLRRLWDGQLVPGYKRYEVLQVVGPRGYEIKNDRLLIYDQYTFLLRTEPIGFGKPVDAAEVGDIVFDTTSAAAFGMGYYRANGKRFNLTACVNALAVIEEQAVAALRDHLANPPHKGQQPRLPGGPNVPNVDEDEVEDDDEDEEPESGQTGRRLTPEQRDEVRTRIAAGEGTRAIAKDMGVAKGTVGYYAKRLRESDEPVSDE